MSTYTEKPPSGRERAGASPRHLDELLDEALIQTFPASDPVAIAVGQRQSADMRSRSGRSGQLGRSAIQPRLEYGKASPEGLAAFRHLNAYIERCGLEHSLLELVKTRASQINGCAYCLDMHTGDARAAGETEQRLYALSAWRETPFFSERERAALAWTEAVTAISGHTVEDALYAEVRLHFSDKEIVDLTLAVIAINGWNRLAIPFRTPLGAYRRRRAAAAAK